MAYIWQNVSRIGSQGFICGYCGYNVASDTGYVASNDYGTNTGYIYICPKCTNPTFLNEFDQQTPGIPFGSSVKDIPEDSKDVEYLYDEARGCVSCNAFTASVLCCRKLLMHIAVSRGAEKGKGFVDYVEFLSEKGYIPPDAKQWVDHIRTKGNEANHEISIMKREDAEDILSFVEMLLKIIYEFPGKIRRKSSSPKPTERTGRKGEFSV